MKKTRKCRFCKEYKEGTEYIISGNFKIRVCQDCIDKPRRRAGKPKKKIVEPEGKIKMPKFVFDDSDKWEEAHKIMDKD